jgi:hypothetical protein
MSDRNWTLDERLHAFRLNDFTPEERALAWKIAECYHSIFWQKALPPKALPPNCREKTSELATLNFGIVRVKQQWEGRAAGPTSHDLLSCEI